MSAAIHHLVAERAAVIAHVFYGWRPSGLLINSDGFDRPRCRVYGA
jgi:hypothetical protein